jgi:hypothetical protein
VPSLLVELVIIAVDEDDLNNCIFTLPTEPVVVQEMLTVSPTLNVPVGPVTVIVGWAVIVKVPE